MVVTVSEHNLQIQVFERPGKNRSREQATFSPSIRTLYKGLKNEQELNPLEGYEGDGFFEGDGQTLQPFTYYFIFK